MVNGSRKNKVNNRKRLRDSILSPFFVLISLPGKCSFLILSSIRKEVVIPHCEERNLRVNLNLSKCLLLSQLLGVYLGVEFQTQPIMNIKRNIILALENRKKNVCQS